MKLLHVAVNSMIVVLSFPASESMLSTSDADVIDAAVERCVTRSVLALQDALYGMNERLTDLSLALRAHCAESHVQFVLCQHAPRPTRSCNIRRLDSQQSIAT